VGRWEVGVLLPQAKGPLEKCLEQILLQPQVLLVPRGPSCRGLLCAGVMDHPAKYSQGTSRRLWGSHFWVSTKAKFWEAATPLHLDLELPACSTGRRAFPVFKPHPRSASAATANSRKGLYVRQCDDVSYRVD
jgi:hypothetical protein